MYQVKITFPAKPGVRAFFDSEHEALQQVHEWHLRFGGYVIYDPATKTFTIKNGDETK